MKPTRAQITFARLDALSRTRALNPRESAMLEEAIHKIDGTSPVAEEPEDYEKLIQSGERWG